MAKGKRYFSKRSARRKKFDFTYSLLAIGCVLLFVFVIFLFIYLSKTPAML